MVCSHFHICSSVIAGHKDFWNGFQKYSYKPHTALLGTQRQRMDGDAKNPVIPSPENVWKVEKQSLRSIEPSIIL